MRLRKTTTLLLGAAMLLAIPAEALAVPPLVNLLPAPDAVEDCVDLAGPAPEWADELTQPADTSVTKIEEWISRPDGTQLEVTVYLPKAMEGPRPTILHYTPYSSQILQAAGWEEAEGTGLYPLLSEAAPPGTVVGHRHCSGYFDHWTPFYLRRGYAFVTADIRGTGDSTGCYDAAGPAEQADGRAIVEWIADQSWSDGNVGMRGFSLDGLSQLATAIADPPALKAIVPTSASDLYLNLRPGGIALDDALSSALMIPPAVRAGSTCSPETVRHMHGLDGHRDQWWQDRWMPLHADKISAAVLFPVGNPADTFFGFGPMWEAFRKAGADVKGIVGPWGHGYPTIDGWELHELRWFEHHLRGLDTGVMGAPSLTLIDQTGAVRTQDRLTPHLTALAPSQSTLIRKATEGQASYTDRPGSPRSVIESDPSAHLRYVTDPFKEAGYFTGSGRFEMVAAIDQTDTNFIVVLYVVAPDGSRRYLTRGFLDAQLHGGMDKPGQPIVPGERVRYNIDLWPGHTLIEAGDRIELVISSSDSCYDCPWVDAPEGYFPFPVRSDLPAATVTIYEGKGESRLMLPLQR